MVMVAVGVYARLMKHAGGFQVPLCLSHSHCALFASALALGHIRLAVHLGIPEPPSLSQDLPTHESKSWREAEPMEAESSPGLCPPELAYPEVTQAGFL